jgi:Tol biopolymer transport system component
MMTCMHQRQCHSEGSETAHDGGWIKLSAHTRRAERGMAGSRQAREGRAQTRRQIGYWSVSLLVAFVLVSASGTRAFGAACPPPADLGCSLTQVTSAIAGDIFRPAMNAPGTHIVFRSTGSLTGENPGEIFVFDTTTTTFTQVTTGAGPAGPPNLRPVINAAGTRIAFSARGNLTGANPDGNDEIFLFDTTTTTFTQITITLSPANNINPVISDSGTRIAFISNADLTRANPDGNFEVFLFDTTTSTFTQVTNTTGSAISSGSATISENGTRIAFYSNGNLTGGNPDGNNEIFLFDTTTSTITQVTNTRGAPFPLTTPRSAAMAPASPFPPTGI